MEKYRGMTWCQLHVLYAEICRMCNVDMEKRLEKFNTIRRRNLDLKHAIKHLESNGGQWKQIGLTNLIKEIYNIFPIIHLEKNIKNVDKLLPKKSTRSLQRPSKSAQERYKLLKMNGSPRSPHFT